MRSPVAIGVEVCSAIFAQRFVVLAQHRFFDEQQVIRFEFVRQHFRHRLVDAPVKIDRDAEVRADGVAHRRHPLDHRFDLGERIDVAQFFGRVHLDRREAERLALQRFGGHVGGTVAADPRIDAHFVADGSAQQFVDRDAVPLALDIPQRLVDPGDSAHQHRTAAIKAGAVEHLPDVLDAIRVAPDQHFLHFGDGGGDGRGVSFDDRLAPACDPLVGRDLDEQPARRHEKKFDFCNFHQLHFR